MRSKLVPINVRLPAQTQPRADRECNHRSGICLECSINVSLHVELTGQYDVGADGRIDRVEAYIPDARHVFIWIAPSLLTDEYEMPLGYWQMRRALLTDWILGIADENYRRRHVTAELQAQQSAYQRALNGKDGY